MLTSNDVMEISRLRKFGKFNDAMDMFPEDWTTNYENEMTYVIGNIEMYFLMYHIARLKDNLASFPCEQSKKCIDEAFKYLQENVDSIDNPDVFLEAVNGYAWLSHQNGDYVGCCDILSNTYSKFQDLKSIPMAYLLWIWAGAMFKLESYDETVILLEKSFNMLNELNSKDRYCIAVSLIETELVRGNNENARYYIDLFYNETKNLDGIMAEKVKKDYFAILEKYNIKHP